SAGRDEEVAVLPGEHQQMRGFVLPHPVGNARIELVIDYTGRARQLTGRVDKEDAQGLFRRHEGRYWYLYSQAESIFARRILPCFDEPRFKPAWRVTAIIPGKLVGLAKLMALGNGPVISERVLPD